MTAFGFTVDVRNRVSSIGNETIPLSVHNLKTTHRNRLQLIMSYDIHISSNSKTIVTAKTVDSGQFHQEVAIAKCLVDGNIKILSIKVLKQWKQGDRQERTNNWNMSDTSRDSYKNT